MADREGLRLAQANRPAAPGQAAGPGKSGLAVRLQLRRTQPDPTTETHGSTTGKAQGAMCLSHGCRPPACFPEARKPHEHWSDPQFKQIATGQRCKSPGNSSPCGEFQQVPRTAVSGAEFELGAMGALGR